MDPMTQSAQISSSQGFADGQNSAAKESKMSDSFISSSPVSLIQSPQDKRVVLGSDKPCEGVATSLRFPSQPGSFTPGKYGSEAGPPDGQPDSPIKTSPVSERIKALEALAAKKKEPDFRSDGGYAHFRDRHHEKSPTEPTKSPTEPTKSPTEPTKSPTETTKSPVEKIAPTVQKRGSSVEPESPESPFEVLGDLKQVGEFEETEEWMKAHLPPVPDLDAVGLTKGPQTADSVPSKELKETDVAVPDAPAAFAGVPDAFMDSPVESPEMKDKFSDSQQPSVEEESEFDLSFLPTAYMWDQQEKPGVQAPSNVSSVLPASPAPPAGFNSPSSPVLPPAATDTQQNVPGDVKPTWTGDLEPPETSEVDSSGESDDTVIEDGVTVPPSSHQAIPHDPSSIDPPASAAQSLPSEEKETPPPRSERKLMQVPTINVIETDEPNYSDEEMEMEAEEEDYEVVKDTAGVAPITSESEDYKNEPPKTRPIETEFMEGYSPPSSPVDSDAEYSPKHKILKPLPETDSQVSEQPENLPTQTDSKVLASEFTEAQPDESQHFSNKGNDESSPFIVTNEEVDFPDNDDEWSDEAQEILVKPTKVDFALEQNPYGDFRLGEKNSTVPKDPYLESSSIPKTSFMQDDIYDRQSFDYDYDVSSPLDDIDDKGLNDKDHLLSDSSEIHVETLSPSTAPSDQPNIGNFTPLNDDETSKPVAQPSLRDYPEDPYSSFQMGTLSSVTEQDFNKKVTGDIGTDSIANGDSISGQKFNPKAAENPDLDGTVSEPSDSFVDFMRECLKSRQDEEAAEAYQGVRSRSELCNPGMTPSQSPPTMVTDLEQEQLTISVLKELASSQEEEEDVVSVKSNIPSQDKVSSNQASVQQSSITSVPNPPCSQSNRAFGSTYSEEVDAIDEWVAEAYHLAEHVLTAILTHLSVKDLIHWRDPKKSGVVFGVSMLMLLSLAAFSIISVVSYLLLALLCVTITFRIYKSVVQAVQKSSDGHPFKALIDKDVSIPPETFRKHVDTSLTYINRGLKQMSRLFLVEDLVDSLKLAVVMWLFTYVGAVFNGITILILADILLFAIPPVYEKNKTQIDQYIDVARTQINTTMAKLQEKLPGAMKRSKTE